MQSNKRNTHETSHNGRLVTLRLLYYGTLLLALSMFFWSVWRLPDVLRSQDSRPFLGPIVTLIFVLSLVSSIIHSRFWEIALRLMVFGLVVFGVAYATL